ncbi:MAG: magnesium/cobalt transporter CorA [Polyangiales bacterium]
MQRRSKKKKRSRRALQLGERFQVGAPPGSVDREVTADPTVVRRIVYDSGQMTEDRFEGTVSMDEFRRRPDQVLWVDVVGLGDGGTIRDLARTFGLHPLALEDVFHQRQRPKAESYGETLFLVMRIPHTDGDATVFEQVSVVLGQDFVLTFQEVEADCFEPLRARIREKKGRVRSEGADYLAYALVDMVVDNYFPLADSIGARIDDIEQDILTSTDAGLVERLLRLKVDLSQLWRNITPSRDAVAAMGNIGGELVSENTRLYLRDCQDHIQQVHELVESYRENVSALVSIHLGASSQRLNEVMKVLTVFAAVFMPLSFIAGVYGMNFDPDISPFNMPELRWRYGYLEVLGVMGLVGAGLLLFFRRRRWIGRP